MTDNAPPDDGMSPEMREFIESQDELRADPKAWKENQRRWRHLHAKMQSSVDDSDWDETDREEYRRFLAEQYGDDGHLEPSSPPDNSAKGIDL